jgi:hypothetical protein
MKIRAKANGDVVDIADDAANPLIEAGIYEAVATRRGTPKRPAKTSPPAPKAPAPKAPAPEKSTKVEPLTTEDMPVPTKRLK